MYSPELLDHFERPRNVGELSAPDAVARVENPACGDIMTLHLRLDGERIAEARFQVKGCAPAIACGSALTELVTGQTVGEARALPRAAVVRAVGGLPPASGHAADLALDALGAALRSVR